jgi:phage FluMu protein Com
MIIKTITIKCDKCKRVESVETALQERWTAVKGETHNEHYCGECKSGLKNN